MLGTENPLAALIALAHQHGAKVLVDGARAVMHHPVDVRRWAAILCFLRPQAVWADRDRRALRPVRAAADDGALGRGGSMIATVSLTEGTTRNQAPWRFEAGTPNTGGSLASARR